jgi:hypothetical protein
MAIEPSSPTAAATELPEKESPLYDNASSHSNSNSNAKNRSESYSSNDKSPAVVLDEESRDETASSSPSEVFDVKAVDPVLARKMALVNSAIDEIGMTEFQWKLFFLNGFGYAVDSVCVTCSAVPPAALRAAFRLATLID